MAKLVDCLEEAVAAGRITRKEAQRVALDIDEFEKQLTLRGEISPEAARTQAEQAVIDARRRATALKRRQAALQIIAIHKAVQNAQAHPRGLVDGITSLLVKDPMRAGYSNVDNRATAVLGQMHSIFAEGLEKMRTRNLGLTQDTGLVRNMVKELFGTDTGSAAAKAVAKQWGEVAEFARQRFNRAGGAVPKLQDWGMPQHHDPILVGKAGKQQWIDDIVPLLDREKMTNAAGVPMDDLEFEVMMGKMFDTIRTNGLADLMPGKQGGSKLANRRQDHRVLAFKDADAWLQYHDRYGTQDIYTTLTDHLNGMANDIAKLEVLGPNPGATYRYLTDLAMKRGELTPGLKKRYLDSIWNVVSGQAQAAESVRFADFSAAVRHLLVAAHLGGAFLSSISDVAFQRQTAKFNGLSAIRTFKRQLSLMNPANAEDRLLAVKLGLTADAWVTRALAANRFVEVSGAGFSAKLSDVVMRASLLSSWTDAGRKAFGMEFMSFMADQTGRSFDELNPKLQEGLTGYGITRDDWDLLRSTELIDQEGVKFFSVENLMNRADLDERVRNELATKLQEMVLTETDFAVPMPDARARAIVTGGTKRGTIMGELARDVGLFKSFPITVMSTHLLRGARQNGLGNKAAYLGSLAVATTVLGAVAMQAKDIARGRDPRNMDDAEFWAAAFIQGGGAGIFGDFIYSGIQGQNRFGKGIVETAAGPVASLTNDLGRLVFGTISDVGTGEFGKIPKRGVDFALSYAPGKSLWYTRLAFERMIADQLKRQVDPKARSRFRRAINRRRKEYDQDHWWRPGEAAPRRLPTN